MPHHVCFQFGTAFSFQFIRYDNITMILCDHYTNMKC